MKDNPRPLCKCGTPVTSRGKTSAGFTKWKSKCFSCSKKKYTVHKGNTCELCGFIPVHKCQLDVDHKDGNKSNNSTDNLQTLCANCHRLKTHLHRDWDSS